MSNAWLADFDAIAHSAFADAGMADTATYRATAAAAPFALPVQCMVDRARATQGFNERGSYTEDTVRVIKQAGLVLAIGGLIDITGERFELRAVIEEDEGAALWAVVSRGPVPPPPEPEAP